MRNLLFLIGVTSHLRGYTQLASYFVFPLASCAFG